MKPRSNGLDLEAIVRQHYDAVFRFCARRIGPDRAPDATQETFLTAHRVLHKFRGDSTVSTWLFGIANNECRRISRISKTQPIAVELDSDQVEMKSHETGTVDRQALQAALTALSDEHKEVVLLHEVEGLTYEEAAEILKVPVGTVKSRLHHAFLNLRRSLDPLGEMSRENRS